MNIQTPLRKVLMVLLAGYLAPAGIAVQSSETVSAADSASASGEQVIPAKRGPNHFVITLGEKSASHPGYGKGHKLGFFLDGKAGMPAVVKRGETYEFDIRTAPMHDVYISSKVLGWGSSPIVDGVKGQFTHKGTITFAPDDKTPDVVYYACQNHKNMGWKVHVVDKDASSAKIQGILADAKAELTKLAGSGKPAVKKSGTKVSHKLALAEMMMAGGGVKRVLASGNDEAKGMVLEAKATIEAGKKALDGGDNNGAERHTDKALKLVSKAQRLVPTKDELKEQATTYEEKLAAVGKYADSYTEQYEDTLKKRGKGATVKYDAAEVKNLVAKAKGLAVKKQYFKASENLQQAELLITSAIQKMMDKQKVVYELNLDTPEGEYKYELGRYKSYHELVPVALEQMKPSKGIQKLMDMYVKKGEDQKAAAVAKAKAGDYSVAIAMILSATKNVRLALKSAGVKQ